MIVSKKNRELGIRRRQDSDEGQGFQQGVVEGWVAWASERPGAVGTSIPRRQTPRRYAPRSNRPRRATPRRASWDTRVSTRWIFLVVYYTCIHTHM